MDFGVLIFPTDTAIRPDELAREVEKRGGRSLMPEEAYVNRDYVWEYGADEEQGALIRLEPVD